MGENNEFKLVEEHNGWNIYECDNEYYIQNTKDLKFFYYVFDTIHHAKRQIDWMVKHNG